MLGGEHEMGGGRGARRCAFAKEESRGLCDCDSVQTEVNVCLQKTWLLRRVVLGVWRDNVVGAEGAWSEVGALEEGPAGRPCSTNRR